MPNFESTKNVEVNIDISVEEFIDALNDEEEEKLIQIMKDHINTNITDLFDREYKEIFTYLSSRYNSNELSIKLKEFGLLPKEM